MAFCKPCRGIIPGILEDHWHHYELVSNARYLLESRKECPCCDILLAAVQQNNEDEVYPCYPDSLEQWDCWYFEDHLDNDRVLVTGLGNSSYPRFSEDKGFHLHGLQITVSVEGGALDGYLGLYNESVGLSSSSQTFIGRFPVPHSGSKEALAVVKSWLDHCIMNHPKCRNTLSGWAIDEDSPPVLPSRVIDVGQSEYSQHPKLVETYDERAHYVALSHCWGPPEKRPLTTNRRNLNRHREEIPFIRLPKTFQDALITTHQIGLKYLWIDSLCIIQGDEADWLKESQRMGSIYENASLTIAASGAADSTFGLFSERPPPQKAVKVPDPSRQSGNISLVLPDSRQKGTFDRYRVESLRSLPDLSPLNSRAWITQEFQLSRRIVHYRKGQMVWSCNTVAHSEDAREFKALVANKTSGSHLVQKTLHYTGSAPDESVASESRVVRTDFWTALVSSYTPRKLTFPSDRLVALQGMVTELQRRWPDQQYIQGLWAESLHEQLLWHGLKEGFISLKRPQILTEIHIPTWSWASTLGPVSFTDTYKVETCCGISIQSDTELILEAHMEDAMDSKLLKFRPPSFDTSFRLRKWEDPTWEPEFHNSEAYVVAQPAALIGWNNNNPTEHLVIDISTEDTIGQAWFDLGVVPKGDVRWFAVSRYREGRVSGESNWRYNVLLMLASDANSYTRVGIGKIALKGCEPGARFHGDGLKHRRISIR